MPWGPGAQPTLRRTRGLGRGAEGAGRGGCVGSRARSPLLGREREGRAEVRRQGGVGSSGLAQAEGTVCARVPSAEMPGTSGPQARAQGAR